MVAITGLLLLVLTALLGEFIGPPLDYYARSMRVEARFEQDDERSRNATWIKEGEVLTLTPSEAIKLGMADAEFSSMEEVLAQHPDVAECAVIAVEDQLKGHIPVGFVVLKAGADHEESDLEKELIGMVRQKIGPVAAFKRAVIAKRLPKTRSGKILRKIMRAIADKRPYSPPSTIEDPAVLDELKTLMHSHKIGQA